MTVVIERDGEVWRVVMGPEFIVSGFTSEAGAGRWFADYLSGVVAKGSDQRGESSNPRGDGRRSGSAIRDRPTCY